MTNTDTILAGPKGRSIHVQTALAQIGRMVLMRTGFQRDTLMYAEDYIKFMLSCHGRRRVWVIVKLDANDTYSVEFGRMNRINWTVLAQLEGIYGDVLGEVIERMYVEVYS